MLMTETNNPASDSQIADFEKLLGSSLPSDYKEFLKTFNGGDPVKPVFDFRIGNTPYSDDMVNSFYGLVDDPYLSLEKFWNISRKGKTVPKDFLLIGYTPGGNSICLCIEGQDFGSVFYGNSDYCQEGEDGDFPTKEGYVKLSGNFRDFLNCLRD